CASTATIRGRPCGRCWLRQGCGRRNGRIWPGSPGSAADRPSEPAPGTPARGRRKSGLVLDLQGKLAIKCPAFHCSTKDSSQPTGALSLNSKGKLPEGIPTKFI